MGRINNNKIKKLKKAANNGNNNNEENDDEKPTTTTITTTSRHDSTKNLHSRVMDINQVQFKASNPKKQAESATFTKMKAASCPGTSHSAKVRYENIKTQFLGNMGKRLRQAQSGDNASNDELSRITKSQPAKPARLTNTMLKSLLGESLKSKKASLDLDTKDEDDANSRKKKDSLLNGVRKTSSQLAKKSKRKLKRHVWQEKIGTIQSQLKKGAEKTKREKTAITGDMQPIIDSLLETGLAKSVDLDEIKQEILNKQSNTNTNTNTKTKTKTKKPSGSTVPIQKNNGNGGRKSTKRESSV